jgi:type I restriction enzyme S subunit
MPSEWRESTLGDLCEFRSGSAFPTEFQGDSSGELPFIKVSDMELPANRRKIEAANNWVSRERARLLRANVHPAGATAFAKIGVALTYNRRRLLVRDTVVDNNMMSAIPYADRVDPGFFYYLLTTVDFNEVVSGTALPYLTQRDLEGMSVSVPPMPLQRAIARILGALDDKIELNRKMNETLEQMARAIFKSWFVDFEPFRDKGMAASPLGEIPKGWSVGTVADLGAVICGKTPPTAEADNFGQDVPFVTIPDMHGRVFVTSTERCLSRRGAETQPGKTVPAGAVCVSCIATVGLVTITSSSSQTNQQINSLVPSPAEAVYYSFFALRSAAADILARGSGGSVVTNLNKGQFGALPVLLPPYNALVGYHASVGAMFGRILANERETRTLAAIRDVLLPKLMSGEVKVA